MMEQEEKIEPIKNQNDLLPTCPYCGADPAVLSLRAPIKLGQFLTAVVFCGNAECRRIFNVHVLGVEQPKVVGYERIHHSRLD